MSSGLCGLNNRKQGIELRDALQRANMERVGGNAKQLRKESDQSNQHEQPSQSGQSFKCDCDSGTNATCTCTRASTGSSASTSRSAATSRSPATGSDRELKSTASRECATATDYIERDYTEYIAATSAQRQGTGTRVRDSIESRYIKQANANSTDSVERRTGIPAGVTI